MFKAFVPHGGHKILDTCTIVYDAHITAAQYIGRSYNYRVANIVCSGDSLLRGMNGIIIRLAQVEFLQKLLEAFSVFGPVNCVRLCTDDCYPCLFKRNG